MNKCNCLNYAATFAFREILNYLPIAQKADKQSDTVECLTILAAPTDTTINTQQYAYAAMGWDSAATPFIAVRRRSCSVG